MNSKLLSLPMFVIVSQLVKKSPFTALWGGSVSVDFIFKIKIMSGSMENFQHLFFSIKKTLILTFIEINLQIYSAHPLTTDANPDEKGCLTASKFRK